MIIETTVKFEDDDGDNIKKRLRDIFNILQSGDFWFDTDPRANSPEMKAVNRIWSNQFSLRDFDLAVNALQKEAELRIIKHDGQAKVHLFSEAVVQQMRGIIRWLIEVREEFNRLYYEASIKRGV